MILFERISKVNLIVFKIYIFSLISLGFLELLDFVLIVLLFHRLFLVVSYGH
jgi:hypothetical protein